MRELRLRRTARRDLAEIYNYTRRRWSRQQADKYLAGIHAEIEQLREKPDIGRPLAGTQADFFRRKSGSHVIFYLAGESILDVVRVLHKAMDFTSHLANDET